MKGLNKVSLIGNVGKEPEINNLEGNIKVAKITLATSESYKDSQGKSQTSTDWHTVILWRNLAELAEKYINKGSLIYIEGKLKTRDFLDKEGVKRFVTEVVADNVILLDKKKDEN